MFASKTATREFALKAAAAAERAIERGACCKSQFKFKCFSCGEMINRGDNITRCIRATTGMKLRYRGADSNNGLTMEEIVFYQVNLVGICGFTAVVSAVIGIRDWMKMETESRVRASAPFALSGV